MSVAAVVFPGQGSQALGMGKTLYETFAPARDAFDRASEAAGFDVADLCFNGPAERLGRTSFTQPCVLTASVAAWAVLLSETGLQPAVAAGHSLGEYSALCAAGAISLEDAVRAVNLRGKLMEEAAPDGVGVMAAILKATAAEVETACAEAAGGEIVVPANYNSEQQTVISGHAQAVERAAAILKEKGARVMPLKVSGPFHTSLMEPAAEGMKSHLEKVSFSDPSFPVVSNVDAVPYPSADSAAEILVRQITNPVRWLEATMEMANMGATTFIESGPGSVLAGLVKRVRPEAVVLPMSEPSHLDAIAKALANGG